MERQGLLDIAALASSPVPIAGDVMGLLADANMYYENPEELTLGNIALSAAGLLPFVPARSAVRVADEAIDTAYQMAHRPSSGARLDDLTIGPDGEGFFPSDLYSPKGKQYYGTGNPDYDDESYEAIMRAYGDPDAEITIYRGVPKDVDDINSGDWVTLSKKYAEDHASYGYGPRGDEAGKVLYKKVKVKDVFSDGNDLNEFGYFPE
jgi:hypothetical protein